MGSNFRVSDGRTRGKIHLNNSEVARFIALRRMEWSNRVKTRSMNYFIIKHLRATLEKIFAGFTSRKYAFFAQEKSQVYVTMNLTTFKVVTIENRKTTSTKIFKVFM